MKRISQIISVMLLVAWPTLDIARTSGGSNNLERFFREVNTFSASFKQVVLDASQNPVQESSGRLWIKRPGKFRWDYQAPYEQKIISDGKLLWIYDVELKQVTRQNLSVSLGQTPAILLAGRGKFKDNFRVKSLGKQGGLEWLQMIPRNSDGSYETIRIGFKKRQLYILEMVDGFGQTTRVTLSGARENRSISNRKFRFVPPKGVDVVGK